MILLMYCKALYVLAAIRTQEVSLSSLYPKDGLKVSLLPGLYVLSFFIRYSSK